MTNAQTRQHLSLILYLNRRHWALKSRCVEGRLSEYKELTVARAEFLECDGVGLVLFGFLFLRGEDLVGRLPTRALNAATAYV